MLAFKRLRLTALVLLMGPAIVDPPEWTALKVLWEIMAQEYEEYKKLEAARLG